MEMEIPGLGVLERLRSEGVVSDQQHREALLHARRISCHAIDAVIDVGAIDEVELLKKLSATYKVQFVSTDKLRNAAIDRRVVRMVPERVATQLLACPILVNAQDGSLSVACGDFEAQDVQKQLEMVTSVRVRLLVARPLAVEALIRKHYRGDRHAFMSIKAPQPKPQDDAHALAGDRWGLDGIDLDSPTKPAVPSDAPAREGRRPRISLDFALPAVAEQLGSSPASAVKAEPAPTPTQASSMGTLEMLNVLVALNEGSREDLRGHSAHVARLCRRVAERMELDEESSYPILMAAYLHDIGKTSLYHLTALNVGAYDGHKVRAQKSYLSPLKMFEGAALPEEARAALSHLYERFDGDGFPDQQKGNQIPLGARMLAVVETYSDLTMHAKNPARKKLGPEEACATIKKYAGAVFDPQMVNLLESVVVGDHLKAQLLEERRVVLVVDPDPSETAVLELKLLESGFEVVIVRNVAEARTRAAAGGLDAVITEAELSPVDGFQLAAELKQAFPDMPIMFLTSKGDRASVDKGFALGAADYVAKPASADVVAAKLRRLIEAERKSGRGVSGSLREMAMPDVVQILSNGRKQGRLSISYQGQLGEIYFAEGRICHANWIAPGRKLAGPDAFYAMLALPDGDFSLDPGQTTPEQTIDMSTEGLLLEGMRRMDEGIA